MKKAPSKNVAVRKVFVRNAVYPVCSSTEVTRPKKRVQFAEGGDHNKPERETWDLVAPEFCSIMKLASDIKKLTIDDLLEKETDTAEEKKKKKKKGSYNVDFHPDERLFPDLISVDVPNEELLRPKSKTIQALPKTLSAVSDPEPDVKEFVKHSLRPEYSITDLSPPELVKPQPAFDGRSIYRLTNKWKVH